MDLILELVKLAAVGILAGAFASYLNNRDHRQKKWWELRVEAYKNAIEALSELLHFFNSQYNAEIQKKDLSSEQLLELTKQRQEGYKKIRLAADTGAFLFSAEAAEILNNYISEMETQYLTKFYYADAGLSSTKKCLKTIVDCSKKDLHLKNAFYDRA